MSKLLQQLRQDHVNIARLLDLLESQLELFHQGEAPDYALMIDIMQYMTNYPDMFHHPREDVLFKRLEQRDASTRLVLNDLIHKHEILAEKGAEFAESLRSVVNEHMIERDTVESRGRDYIHAQRHHMDVEEGQVLPLAVRTFSDEDWAAVDESTASMEDPLFGEVVQKEYLALYDRIRQQGA